MGISYFPALDIKPDWGNIDGSIDEQVDLIELIDTKVDKDIAEINASYYFNGINSKIEIDLADEFSFTNGIQDSPFSICIVFKPNNFDNYNYLFSKGESNPEYTLFIDLNGHVVFRLYSGSISNYVQVQSNKRLNIKEVSFITATYDGSGIPSGLKIYINGNDHTGLYAENNYSDMIASTELLKIGNFLSNYSKGVFYCSAIFNSSISETIINDFIQKGIINFYVNIVENKSDLLLLLVNNTAYPQVWFDSSDMRNHAICSNCELINIKDKIIAYTGMITENTEISDFIPSRYAIDKIILECHDGGATGKMLNIGTSAGGNDIVELFEVNANNIVELTPIKKVFHTNNSIYINDLNTITTWNSGVALEFTLHFYMNKIY